MASSSEITTLSQFEDNQEWIAKGGFGQVYKMQHRKSKKYYAVKVVNMAQWHGDDETTGKIRDGIFQEAETLERIKHPNIVKVVASFSEFKNQTDMFFIVMELCGKTLRMIIKETPKNDPISEITIVRWAAQILTALEYLHVEELILHRDIKSPNIMVGPDGKTLKVGDFGISKTASSKSQLLAQTQIGTQSHMPPEVYKENGGWDWKSDSWSLGVVLYEVCEKELPFPEGLSAVVAVTKGVIPTISTANYSAALRNVVAEKMLVRDLELRASIPELCRHQFFADAVLDWQCEAELKAALPKLQTLRKQDAAVMTELLSENKSMRSLIKQLQEDQKTMKTEMSALRQLKPESNNLKLQEEVHDSPLSLFGSLQTSSNFEMLKLDGPSEVRALIDVGNNALLVFYARGEIHLFRYITESTLEPSWQVIALSKLVNKLPRGINQACFVATSNSIFITAFNDPFDGLFEMKLAKQMNADFPASVTVELVHTYSTKNQIWDVKFDNERNWLFTCIQGIPGRIDVFSMADKQEYLGWSTPSFSVQMDRGLKCCAPMPNLSKMIIAVSSKNISFYQMKSKTGKLFGTSNIAAVRLDDMQICNKSGNEKMNFTLGPSALSFDSTGKWLAAAFRNDRCVRLFRVDIAQRQCMLVWQSSNQIDKEISLLGLMTFNNNVTVKCPVFVADSRSKWIAKFE